VNTRILIVTNGPLCRNPRSLKEADTLGRAGYDVTVLAVRNHAISEAHDRVLLQGAPFRREVIDMIPGFETASRTIFRRRLILWVARQAANYGLAGIHALGPVEPLLRNARRLPADLTIVHNELPHWVGVQLMKQGRRVAADIEDWHSEDLLPEDRLRRPLSRIRAVEHKLLTRAAYTTTTSRALADALQARYGGPGPVVISNSFPLQPDPHRGAPGQPPVFFWFSQTLGAGRGLELFLAAWRQTREPSRLVLLGQPTPGFDQRLLSRLPAEWHSRVAFLPLVPPADLPGVIARHDVGLALEQPFIVNRNLTITNKILQYLNAGLAVVASDTAGQREVLARRPEAGVIVEMHETTYLAETLDRLLADKGALIRRQAAARQLAEDTYCWERETPNLLALVARARALD
jgi:glycosyltransferase involved in cell wall biosynthesis